MESEMKDTTEVVPTEKGSEQEASLGPTHEDKVKMKSQIDSQVGTAPIKLEFIDYSRIHLLYGVESINSNKKQEEQPKDKPTEEGEPPMKKSKKERRGQNKKRPSYDKRAEASHRICPKLLRKEECLFGDKCMFRHDIAELVKEKPPDLGPVCYNFQTYGKCLRGVMCRYGSAHISSDYQNIVDEEKWSRCKDLSVTKNNLSKDLQFLLRKRKAKFTKSDKYLAVWNKVDKQRKESLPKQNQEVPVAVKPCDKTVVTGSNPENGSNDDGVSQKPDVCETECNTKDDKMKAIKIPETSTTVDEQSEQTSVDPAQNNDVNSNHSLKSSCHGDKKPGVEPCIQRSGVVTDEDLIKMRSGEKKTIDFRDKLYLAPLTTVGNLPFRRICKGFKADITCGEMAMCTNLLQGQASEWALLKRHSSEDIFGVQIAGAFPDTMTKCAEILNDNIDIDFVDINVGCPIDLVYNKGSGCGLMNRVGKFEGIVRGMNTVLDVPLTVKMRTGVYDKHLNAAKIIPRVFDWGASLVTLHGRTREQRYTKSANWDYIGQCVQAADPYPMFGNGDVLSFEDANLFKEKSGVAGLMMARGALIKPWIFTEIKEQRHWDISSGERFDMLKDYVNYGLEHWGSDTEGVEKTRRFLLEWLSFLHRYIPVGVLERVPQQINQRPPYYVGRDDLETLMSSHNCNDWIKISEMLLGPVPDNFQFLPKHKANSYR